MSKKKPPQPDAEEMLPDGSNMAERVEQLNKKFQLGEKVSTDTPAEPPVPTDDDGEPIIPKEPEPEPINLDLDSIDETTQDEDFIDSEDPVNEPIRDDGELVEIATGSAFEDDSDLEEEESFDTEEYVIRLPYQRCHACTHLMPNIDPTIGKVSKDKKSGKLKVLKAKPFPCYVESLCPARQVKMVFDPFTDEMVLDTVAKYLETSDAGLLVELSTKAGDISPNVLDRVNGLVKEALRAHLIES